ncbi:Hypothetical_protein [Hexamita inflata]|uniref:Hypothetical_protein n=1 Tax=Hexamita inflata TaxID=28002 RepID=A0AA86QKZ6_9EUKA|nr:Hypothetical protein HINF_LOCUS49159 [Hexamita inflata]CAI9961518.1 Hypothetical protein HINF_LOCUS49163 [Hexamita inflata]CAI9961521.1 Hypothetical protein HINF_LOCUS49166 [Hexamita inflata]
MIRHQKTDRNFAQKKQQLFEETIIFIYDIKLETQTEITQVVQHISFDGRIFSSTFLIYQFYDSQFQTFMALTKPVQVALIESMRQLQISSHLFSIVDSVTISEVLHFEVLWAIIMKMSFQILLNKTCKFVVF